MTPKHKIFISFHHDESDGKEGSLYRNAFENLFRNKVDGFMTNAIHDGDIDPELPEEEIKETICKEYIRDTNVTVVLIGPTTYTRMYIDWEISASLRVSPDGYPSGLLGVILPEHPDFMKDSIDPAGIPARLADNLTTGFASICHWTFSVKKMAAFIHDAAQKRTSYQYNDSRPLLHFNLDPRSKIHYTEKKYVSLTRS
jgi:hypothetical protein